MHTVSETLLIDPAVDRHLAAFSLPSELAFGEVMVPIMYRADYENGQWYSRRIIPYGPIQMDPACKVLHYGQEVFEGLKAYAINGQRPTIFRPEENLRRMNTSAQRLAMPDIPQSIFMEGISVVTALASDYIPNESGSALYLRPFMLGMEASLNLGESNNYSFMVIASPSAGIHSGAMKVMVERNHNRAAVGGTGHVKVGGNYASATLASKEAREKGYHHVLWLDPYNRQSIEELSGMNLFAVVDGQLLTPKLSGSILPGITRDSVIQLARHLNIDVLECSIDIDDLLADIESLRCSEMFACGTAAILAPINVVNDGKRNSHGQGKEYLLNGDKISAMLKEKLLAIQESRADDSFAWNYAVPDKKMYLTDLACGA